MTARRWGVAALLALFAAVPAFAAEEPCNEKTSTCLNKLSRMFRERGWAGLEMESSANPGLVVTRVLDGSPAQKAGLLPGDEIVAINGTRIADGAGLVKLLRKTKPGTRAAYTIARNGSERSVEVDLGAIPQAVMTRWITKYTNGDSAKMEFSEYQRRAGDDHPSACDLLPYP